MSSFEMAHQIVNQMNEEQLQGFISLFGGMFRKAKEKNSKQTLTEKQRAFQELENLIKPCHIADDKNEYFDYLDERYGS